jgi:hypothetical protein
MGALRIGWGLLVLAAAPVALPAARTAAEQAEFDRRVAEFNEAQEARRTSRREFARDLPGFRVTQVTYLDPRLQFEASPDIRRMHGYAVFASTAIRDDALGTRLASSLLKVVEAWDDGITACFTPRHVLTITDGSNTYDVVTCFECMRYVVHRPDGSTWFGDSFTSRKEEAEWNRLFRQAGLEWPYK